RLTAVLEAINSRFEIIIVNDCSPDRDWQIIEEMASKDERVKGINLSRNFGEHYAITAGVDHASGDWVVVMDGDLEDQREEIVSLYKAATGDGHDVVFAQRRDRKDNVAKILGSRAFNLVLNWLSDLPIRPGVNNFSIFSRRVAEN